MSLISDLRFILHDVGERKNEKKKKTQVKNRSQF